MAKHRILVIDDDKDVCSVLQVALSQNYEVITANDGYDGLKKIQSYEPDLVILDVMMPKLDGHQLCEAIKHSRKTKNTRVIFCTGYASSDDEFSAFQQGADLYFRKPFDVAQVVEEIDKLLAKTAPQDKILSYNEILSME